MFNASQHLKQFRGHAFYLVQHDNESKSDYFSPVSFITHYSGEKLILQIIRDIECSQLAKKGEKSLYSLFAYPASIKYYSIIAKSNLRVNNSIKIIDFSFIVSGENIIKINKPNYSICFKSTKILDKNSNVKTYNYYITHPFIEIKESFIQTKLK